MLMETRKIEGVKLFTLVGEFSNRNGVTLESIQTGMKRLT